MNEQYRGFNLCGGCDPVSETLRGQVTKWKQPDALLTSIATDRLLSSCGFTFPRNCDDENVAKCFGLEIARILLDSSFRDFAIARYESETRRIQESRRYFRSVKAER